MNKTELAKMIDHTLLGPTASTEGVRKLCDEAKEYGFASVCVNPCHTALVRELLDEDDPKVCVVIGFPHGMSTSEVKGFEAQKAIADGADELDMVINVAALKAGNYRTVSEDIRAVCSAAEKAPRRALVKVILETSLLDDTEKRAGAILAKAAGADFVKTSTGFASGGATVEDVALLRETVGPELGVKAAGGIHTYEEALAMIEAGATRIGASRSVAIVEGAPE
ncbi:deoxyribose-phosphate aldolase [Candidatus Bipolaricaulota bacterium]|nr:deoxyribose-phosphate aldolase [Candidatus Bipolaricaulota bacterium]